MKKINQDANLESNGDRNNSQTRHGVNYFGK